MPADPPPDPIAAVTHPDPYPYYERLVRERPFHFDARLNLWVAASAAAVEAVLTSDLCRVRPPAEPVPRHLGTGMAAAVFGRLVRQTEGPERDRRKRLLQAALAAIPAEQVAAATRERLRALRGLPPDDLLFALPVQAMARLLGLTDRLDETAMQLALLVRSFLPQADSAAMADGDAAAKALLARLRAAGGLAQDGLMRHLRGDDVMLANALGLLVQTHDATAALLGNALLALARQPVLHRQLAARPDLLPAFVQEAMRHDAPVQNTRRFAAADGTLCGQAVPAGAAVLVLLAAANRDPAANTEPHRFLIERRQRRLFGFGHGSHRCAGPDIAATIAATAIAEMIATATFPVTDVTALRYRPSSNARIPIFARS